jgi:alanine racemase
MNSLRTWIEINPDHFDYNIAQYKRIIGSRNLSVVIKANAYGHGLTQIARLANSNPTVHSLCVATIDEALQIRKAGITKPIIMPSVLEGDPRKIIDKNVTLAIYDFESAHLLQKIGTLHNYIFPVHIKIDTGLSRLGILPEEIFSYVKRAQKMPNLSIQGIYSHCAESHKQENAFTLEQQAIFKCIVDGFKEKSIIFPFVHLANSAATTALDLPFCNLFRIGIGAFGLWPSPENKIITQKKYPWFDLKPILTWKTVIRNIKQVPAGSFIGYDRTYQAPHDMLIGTLPIGYYDGYDFRLYNKGSVMVHGKNAPIVGRISMNMCSIDVSQIPNARIHDEIILMGPHHTIHPYQLGLLTGNPNVREMTTKINPKIHRLVSKKTTILLEKDLSKKPVALQ